MPSSGVESASDFNKPVQAIAKLSIIMLIIHGRGCTMQASTGLSGINKRSQRQSGENPVVSSVHRNRHYR